MAPSTIDAHARRVAQLLLLANLVACSCTATPDQEPRAADPTQPVKQPPQPQAKAEPPIEPAYFALGCLSEYAGAYQAQWHEDAICTFARGQRPEAVVYQQYLERLARECELDTNIIVRDGAGGCTVVASQMMKGHLVSLYPPYPGRVATGKRMQGSVTMGMFKTREAKRSYLAGVYLRHKQGDALVLANSAHKVTVICQLLTDLGASHVDRKRTPRGHYPTMFTVSFAPSHEIERLFQFVDAQREAARQR